MEAETRDLLRRIETLEHVAAIKELKSRYWSSLDAQRPDDVRDCFLPEAVIDMEGVPRCDGRDAFITIIKEQGCRPGLCNMHHGHNARIALTGAASATGIWDSYFHGIDVGARTIIQLAGVYNDRYVFREGRWWIAEILFRQTSFMMEKIADDGSATVLALGTQNAAVFGK